MPQQVFEQAFQLDGSGKPKARGRNAMRHLYEVFLSCKEDWAQSNLVLNSKASNTSKRIGCCRWRKYEDLVKEHGEAVAAEMQERVA